MYKLLIIFTFLLPTYSLYAQSKLIFRSLSKQQYLEKLNSAISTTNYLQSIKNPEDTSFKNIEKSVGLLINHDVMIWDIYLNNGITSSWKKIKNSIKSEIDLDPPFAGLYHYQDYGKNIELMKYAVSLGKMSPGLSGVTTEVSWKFGHCFSYGEGIYTAVLLSNLTSECFFSNNIEKNISQSIKNIPDQSKVKMLALAIIQKKSTWVDAASLTYLVDSLTQNETYFNPVLYNLGSILLALKNNSHDLNLFYQSIINQKGDINLNLYLGGQIWGVLNGEKQISENLKFEYLKTKSRYITREFSILNSKASLILSQVAFITEGTIRGKNSKETYILVQDSVQKLVFEQPYTIKKLPVLKVSRVFAKGLNQKFTCWTSDTTFNQFQWFWGDLKLGNGKTIEHKYLEKGDYEIICFASDLNGNVISQSFIAEIDDKYFNNNTTDIPFMKLDIEKENLSDNDLKGYNIAILTDIEVIKRVDLYIGNKYITCEDTFPFIFFITTHNHEYKNFITVKAYNKLGKLICSDTGILD